jgi:hypothetical protein
MMKIHLDQVIPQAVDELKGNHAAGARAFEPYIRHILDMADMISSGIIKQFPARFFSAIAHHGSAASFAAGPGRGCITSPIPLRGPPPMLDNVRYVKS